MQTNVFICMSPLELLTVVLMEGISMQHWQFAVFAEELLTVVLMEWISMQTSKTVEAIQN